MFTMPWHRHRHHRMSPTKGERSKIKDLVLDRYCDWAGVQAAFRQRNLEISQTSLERFFNGRSGSTRTLRKIAVLLSTTPQALVAHARLVAVSPGRRKGARTPSISDQDAYRIAFQLWIEMTTRKLGMPIDLRHDLVVELYDSWYAFFKTARELIKAIPLHRDPGSREMRRLVEISRAVLNEGLRPHLEQWQARFRTWWAVNGSLAVSADVAPQEAQSHFPQWELLRHDLLAANQRLTGYLTTLEQMVAPPSPRRSPKAQPPQRTRTPARS